MPAERNGCHAMNFAHYHFGRVEEFDRKPAVGHNQPANHNPPIIQRWLGIKGFGLRRGFAGRGGEEIGDRTNPASQIRDWTILNWTHTSTLPSNLRSSNL